ALIHCQGRAELTAEADEARLDLPAVRAACDHRILEASECYRAFQAMGLQYGPGFRGLEEVAVNSTQALARLALPPTLSATEPDLGLHPSLLDAAFQASIGLLDPGDSAQSRPPALPFAVDAVDILGPCAPQMWAWVRTQ